MTEVKRGDLVWVDLSGAMYSEQGKVRLAIIVQNDKGNAFATTTIVVPITSELKKPNLPTHTVIKKCSTNGLRCDSMVLCEQIRTVGKQRITSVIGRISDEDMENVHKACVANFGL